MLLHLILLHRRRLLLISALLLWGFSVALPAGLAGAADLPPLPEVGRPPEPAETPDEADPPPKEPAARLPERIELRDFLVLGRVGDYGRTPFHTDWLEAKLVEGDYKTPEAGNALTGADNITRLWEKATAGKDGWLEHDALTGGYALATVDAPAAGVMILEPRGHSTVLINGEARAGDPYNAGWLRLPVQLKKGKNEFLFHVGRRRVLAKLVTPRQPIMLDRRDNTLPDLLIGDDSPRWGAMLVINATDKPLRDLALVTSRAAGQTLRTPAGVIAPLSVRKVGFQIDGATSPGTDSVDVVLKLVRKEKQQEQVLDENTFSLAVRQPTERHVRTFVSDIDGSVQYYAVQPAKPSDQGKPGIVLTLHGASVEATNQAAQYAAREWAHFVAPTNRRPFGFDWEDWGRIDALEVLADAQDKLPHAPRRTWLTGHSMGGHGAWHIGATFPDRFAAIGPSAGWFSFWSYGGMPKIDTSTAVGELLARGSLASDTLKIKSNLAGPGVYILHGDQDDNVPVSQARFMRQQLGNFHRNFAYYERPGAGHWWGAQCCDWPPMLDFFQRQSLPVADEVDHVSFATANPGISATAHWATIANQQRQFQLSEVHLDLDRQARRFTGSTKNVSRLKLDVSSLPPNEQLHVDVDGDTIKNIAWPGGDAGQIWLVRDDDTWKQGESPDPAEKGPHRYGGFKQVFNNRAVLVYGTRGNAAENAWSIAKARFDAETFLYRGNGSFEVVADRDFDVKKYADRNVVVYGNADTNGAWPTLLSTCPVQIRRDAVRFQSRPETGDDVACLMVRPHPHSDTALVGVVSGTGPAGMQATNRLRYFVSGVAYPDFILFGSDFLTEGFDEIRALGYFGNDWGIDSAEIEWRDLAL